MEKINNYLEETPDGAKLVFVAVGNIIVKIIIAIFIIFWLRVWVMGEQFACTILFKIIQDFFTKNIDFSDKATVALLIFTAIFLSIWVIGWTFGGFVAIYYVFSMFFFKKEIEIKQGFLIISKKYGFFTYSRKSYNLFEAKHFHAQKDYGFSRNREPYPDTIRFYYRNELVSFGAGIDEAEGRAILETLRQKHLLTDYHFSQK